MSQTKRWKIAQTHPDRDALAGSLQTSPIIAQILLNRGISDAERGREFLEPNLKLLHDPSLVPNMQLAAERLAKAVRDGEKVVIYGDYDVDGITATAILWHAIRALGGVAEYYIPHRIEEGYGLNAEAIDGICQRGAKLIISVDCGITAVEPAETARRHGVDLIITDHHEAHGDGRLPQCFALVHPRLAGSQYPNPHICGAGVAFKLAWALGRVMSGSHNVADDYRGFMIDALSLTALGTIADVVPLVGENRVLAANGLKGLCASRLNGLRALIAGSGLDGKKLDSYDVGFLLAPRLNACGRMGHAGLAVEMLTTATEEKAAQIATFLDQQNRARQAMERQILEQAIEHVKATGQEGPDSFAIVAAGEGWHPGVIGIVASRLVDRFHKPTLMIGINDGVAQGSGRSISGFHLARALEACTEHLEAHGGHEMAVGLKLLPEKLPAFREAFAAYAREHLPRELLVPELKLEAEMQLGQVTRELVSQLARLGPFGQANRRPVLACRALTLTAAPRRVGKTGDHLQLRVGQGRHFMKCIAFNQGAIADRLHAGMTLDMAVEPTLNEFNGTVTVELEVRDVLLPDASAGQSAAGASPTAAAS